MTADPRYQADSMCELEDQSAKPERKRQLLIDGLAATRMPRRKLAGGIRFLRASLSVHRTIGERCPSVALFRTPDRDRGSQDVAPVEGTVEARKRPVDPSLRPAHSRTRSSTPVEVALHANH